MAKSPLVKTLEKQMRENKNQANKLELVERARLIVESQPIIGNMRIMDEDAEQLLDYFIERYDGNELNRVHGEYSTMPIILRNSLSFELEKLMLYGVVARADKYSRDCYVYLSTQGKSYFENKKSAESIKQEKRSIMSERKRYDVFISHASKDKLDYVDSLFISLRKLGINIFYDTEIISWGDDWKKVILDGVLQSEFAIIVISKNFFGREWTERELDELLKIQNENNQKVVLPLII